MYHHHQPHQHLQAQFSSATKMPPSCTSFHRTDNNMEFLLDLERRCILAWHPCLLGKNLCPFTVQSVKNRTVKSKQNTNNEKPASTSSSQNAFSYAHVHQLRSKHAKQQPQQSNLNISATKSATKTAVSYSSNYNFSEKSSLSSSSSSRRNHYCSHINEKSVKVSPNIIDINHYCDNYISHNQNYFNLHANLISNNRVKDSYFLNKQKLKPHKQSPLSSKVTAVGTMSSNNYDTMSEANSLGNTEKRLPSEKHMSFEATIKNKDNLSNNLKQQHSPSIGCRIRQHQHSQNNREDKIFNKNKREFILIGEKLSAKINIKDMQHKNQLAQESPLIQDQQNKNKELNTHLEVNSAVVKNCIYDSRIKETNNSSTINNGNKILDNKTKNTTRYSPIPQSLSSCTKVGFNKNQQQLKKQNHNNVAAIYANHSSNNVDTDLTLITSTEDVEAKKKVPVHHNHNHLKSSQVKSSDDEYQSLIKSNIFYLNSKTNTSKHCCIISDENNSDLSKIESQIDKVFSSIVEDSSETNNEKKKVTNSSFSQKNRGRKFKNFIKKSSNRNLKRIFDDSRIIRSTSIETMLNTSKHNNCLNKSYQSKMQTTSTSKYDGQHQYHNDNSSSSASRDIETNSLSSMPAAQIKNSNSDEDSSSTNIQNYKNNKVKYLGVYKVDPNDYVKKHGCSLIKTEALPTFCKIIPTPHGIELAASNSFENKITSKSVKTTNKQIKASDKNKQSNKYKIHRYSDGNISLKSIN